MTPPRGQRGDDKPERSAGPAPAIMARTGRDARSAARLRLAPPKARLAKPSAVAPQARGACKARISRPPDTNMLGIANNAASTATNYDLARSPVSMHYAIGPDAKHCLGVRM